VAILHLSYPADIIITAQLLSAEEMSWATTSTASFLTVLYLAYQNTYAVDTRGSLLHNPDQFAWSYCEKLGLLNKSKCVVSGLILHVNLVLPIMCICK